MKIILIVLILCTSVPIFAQNAVDCSQKQVQDSLFNTYSKKAHEFSLNDKEWVQIYDSLISICPNISEAYQERGLAYLVSGDTSQLFANIDKAAELDRTRWLPYRGYLHCIYAKNYQKAITDFEEAEKLMPNAFTMDHSFSFYLAMAHTGLGNFEKAETYFLKDIATQKRGTGQNDIHYNTLLYFGIMHFLNNELDKSETRLRECLQLYEQHPTANYYMALIMKATGNKQQAAFFEKAKQYSQEGYKINEPNSYLVPYPYQVSMADLGLKENN
ncbi:tetratricopeptide repeat protein [Dyadobacter sp. CY323]|uniref:tetratricopeptide repeat protein n=1 Tax=Dyadobacter sp. CY323 TaxID=2907302 RepID=UPI001F424427|nr:tetratricopeptide repeat protein [Dyadobacter sp. CY323]MCE6987528.1 tetratricopeptide repeat protein [Dyadobacter sp. CY323]